MAVDIESFFHSKKQFQRTESSESDEEIKKTRVRTQRDIHVRQVGEKVVSTTTYTRAQKNIKSETHHNVFSEPEEISIDLGTPDDRYKSEKAVNVSAPPPKVFFATAWGKEADLDDLVDACIVDDETRRLIQVDLCCILQCLSIFSRVVHTFIVYSKLIHPIL